MKITYEFPDDTLCAFVCYVYRDYNGSFQMGVHSSPTDELKHGGVVPVYGIAIESEDEDASQD